MTGRAGRGGGFRIPSVYAIGDSEEIDLACLAKNFRRAPNRRVRNCLVPLTYRAHKVMDFKPDTVAGDVLADCNVEATDGPDCRVEFLHCVGQ